MKLVSIDFEIMLTNETCNCLNDIAQYADDDVIKIQILLSTSMCMDGKIRATSILNLGIYICYFLKEIFISRFFIGHKTFVVCVVCFFPFQWQCWQFLLIISSCFTNELKKHSMNFTINWKWYCARKAGNLSWLALSVLQLMPQKYHRDNEMWKLLVSKLAFINQSIIRSLSLGGAKNLILMKSHLSWVAG